MYMYHYGFSTSRRILCGKSGRELKAPTSVTWQTVIATSSRYFNPRGLARVLATGVNAHRPSFSRNQSGVIPWVEKLPANDDGKRGAPLIAIKSYDEFPWYEGRGSLGVGD